MNLQISPFGIAIIAAYSLMVIAIIAWPLSRWLRRWRLKWALIVPIALPLLAAPWAEEAWIAWNFTQACKDAGVHVYRKVEVDGFYDETGAIGAGLVKNNRYSFVEYRRLYNRTQVEHAEKSGGDVQFTFLTHPTARYHFKYADPRQDVRIGWKLMKHETVVVDSTNGEIVGRDTHFKRYPSVAEGLWMRLVGSGLVTCQGKAPSPPDLRYPLYHYVLVPARKN